jgi:hypothetical protein
VKLLAAAAGAFLSTVSAAVADDILIFAGANHDQFLGCLTCSKHASDSVLNQWSEYGSRWSSTSIFNRWGQFGGRWATHSPCNPYSSDPPVLVDRAGNFYGYLTIGQHPQANREPPLIAWLSGVCAAQ